MLANVVRAAAPGEPTTEPAEEIHSKYYCQYLRQYTAGPAYVRSYAVVAAASRDTSKGNPAPHPQENQVQALVPALQDPIRTKARRERRVTR
jgi:hypothetical protein